VALIPDSSAGVCIYMLPVPWRPSTLALEATEGASIGSSPVPRRSSAAASVSTSAFSALADHARLLVGADAIISHLSVDLAPPPCRLPCRLLVLLAVAGTVVPRPGGVRAPEAGAGVVKVGRSALGPPGPSPDYQSVRRINACDRSWGLPSSARACKLVKFRLNLTQCIHAEAE